MRNLEVILLLIGNRIEFDWVWINKGWCIIFCLLSGECNFIVDWYLSYIECLGLVDKYFIFKLGVELCGKYYDNSFDIFY